MSSSFLVNAKSGPAPSQTAQRETSGPTETLPGVEFPEPEERENEDADLSPEPAVPSESLPPPSSRPKFFSLIRFLFPLVILLIPLLRFLARDSFFSSPPASRPVLRDALLCERIAQGRPVNPREMFSLRRDQRVFLYSLWRGSPGNHAYSLRWHPPTGAFPISSAAVVVSGAWNRNFAGVSFLPLKPGMPLGQWRVEVYLDREVRASLRFELRE